eukprot:1428508-Lingulodinium_polyedra.AAC.1
MAAGDPARPALLRWPFLADLDCQPANVLPGLEPSPRSVAPLRCAPLCLSPAVPPPYAPPHG